MAGAIGFGGERAPTRSQRASLARGTIPSPGFRRIPRDPPSLGPSAHLIHSWASSRALSSLLDNDVDGPSTATIVVCCENKRLRKLQQPIVSGLPGVTPALPGGPPSCTSPVPGSH